MTRIHKALLLVEQVRSSPRGWRYASWLCDLLDVPPTTLRRYVVACQEVHAGIVWEGEGRQAVVRWDADAELGGGGV